MGGFARWLVQHRLTGTQALLCAALTLGSGLAVRAAVDGMVHRRRIESGDACAFGNQRLDERNRRGVAHIVSLRLKTKSQYRNPFAFDAADDVRDLG